MTASSEPLLRAADLSVTYGHRGRAAAPAVHDVSFSVRQGETVGLVGESGSGKSSIAKAVLGLIRPSSGSIHFGERDITNPSRKMRRALAHELQVVFQDPFSSLNPARTVGSSLIEPLLVGRSMSVKVAQERARSTLSRVGLPVDAMSRFPANFSGGQRQRIAIARALVMEPKLIVCDEPVSALDLSIQAQVLNLLIELQHRDDLSYLFISHDLSVVRYLAHQVLVLQRGEIVEQGPGEKVWNAPQHPYTQALIASVPKLDPSARQPSAVQK